MDALSELVQAATALANAVDDETAALEEMRGITGVDAAKAAESRVVECSQQLRALLARIGGEA